MKISAILTYTAKVNSVCSRTIYVALHSIVRVEENALPPAPESLLLLKANMSFLCEECKIWASVGCRKREVKVPVDDESSGLVEAIPSRNGVRHSLLKGVHCVKG